MSGQANNIHLAIHLVDVRLRHDLEPAFFGVEVMLRPAQIYNYHKCVCDVRRAPRPIPHFAFGLNQHPLSVAAFNHIVAPRLHFSLQFVRDISELTTTQELDSDAPKFGNPVHIPLGCRCAIRGRNRTLRRFSREVHTDDIFTDMLNQRVAVGNACLLYTSDAADE